MITIKAGLNTITAPDGTMASGAITVIPVDSFEYSEGGARRKVGRKATVINITDGVMIPSTIDIAPTSGMGHVPANIYYIATWRLNGFAQWTERWSLPASAPVVDLLDIILLNTPTLPAYPVPGPRGQSIDHTRLTLGDSSAGSVDTYTVWGDAAESIVLGTFDVVNGTVTGPVNNIGVLGAQGFGVGICPRPPAGIVEMVGTRDPASDNYGNYQYSDGSIMVWIPAFYYKYGTGSNGFALNVVDILPFSSSGAAGYALHRAFWDGGAIQPGVFVDKYQCSNNGGIASSIRYGAPLSTSTAHNPIGALINTPPNNFGGAILAAKSRGANFFCCSRFIFSALAMLSLAHGQAATAATWCAWFDGNGITNFPKGNNNNALGDANDASIHYVSDGYTNAGQCGSANLFSRTTHNGQNCGVADLNGNMWEINPGITSDGANLYVMSTSAKMSASTAGNTLSTDAFGAAALAARYINLGATHTSLWATGANRAVPFGSPTSQTLSDATSGAAWNTAGAGVPLATGGSNKFGNDYLWDYKPNEMCPIAGGYWSAGGGAGVWALALNAVRANSSSHVGFRSALYL